MTTSETPEIEYACSRDCGTRAFARYDAPAIGWCNHYHRYPSLVIQCTGILTRVGVRPG